MEGAICIGALIAIVVVWVVHQSSVKMDVVTYDTSYPAVPEAHVKVFLKGEALPEHHVRVATIFAQGMAHAEKNKVIRKLRQEAGRLGGNGIVISDLQQVSHSFGRSTSPSRDATVIRIIEG